MSEPEFDDDAYALPYLDMIYETVELDEAISACAVSMDGSMLAVGTADDEIYCYDARTGKLTHEFEGHLGGTNSIAFIGSSGERLVSTGEDGTVRVWSMSSEDPQRSFECEGYHVDKTPTGWTVDHVVSDKEGRFAACAAGKTVHLINLDADCEPADAVAVLPAVEAGSVNDIRFTPGGHLMVAFYGGLNLVPPEAGAAATMLPHKANLLSVAVSPDEQWFVAGCHDCTVHIWRLQFRKELGGYESTELTCGGYGEKVRVCNWQPGKGATLLATCGGPSCTVWDFSGSGPAGQIPVIAIGHLSTVTCQAWKPDGSTWMATGGTDGGLSVFDVSKPEPNPALGLKKFCGPLAVSDCPGEEVISCHWAPTGIIIAAFSSGRVRGYRLPQGMHSEMEESRG